MRIVAPSVVLVAVATLLQCVWPAAAQGDPLQDAYSRALQLYNVDKYVEAIPFAERAAALSRSRFGDDHFDYATRLVLLGALYQFTKRHAEAEDAYKRSLAIREKALAEGL